ncbi:MAG: ADOP family duplicated permease [Gemmatimonadota bacterium]
MRDLKDGLRHLAHRPGFTLLAVGTLALGLAASSAVFTYVNAYQQPFPGADAGGLYQIYQHSPATPYDALSYPDFEDLVASAGAPVELAGVGQSLFAASARHESLTEVVFGQAVTGAFFPVARVDMALGRALTPGDDRADAPAAVVISHEYWRRRYASSSDVLGSTLLLNNDPYTIVGVTGPEFLGTSSAFRPEIWLPFESYMRVYWARSDTRNDRSARVMLPFLRLADRSQLGPTSEALSTLADGLDRAAPLPERTRTFTLQPATWISPATREAEAATTRVLKLAAAALLLLACANVSNIVLAAGARRRWELSLRSALGASRWRLVRQLLVESVLLSLLAGGAALLFAGPAGARLGSYFARPSVWGSNVSRTIEPDLRVLAFGVLIAVVAGLVTGLLPALRVAHRDPAAALATGPEGEQSSGRRRWLVSSGDVLIAVQVALSVVLLLVAALVVRTFDVAGRVDAGFAVEHTLASYVSTSSMGVPVEERHRFFQQLIERFQEQPWVEAATVAQSAPLSDHPSEDLRLPGLSTPVRTTVARVWPGYFETLEMEIVRGRSLLATDTAVAAGVVIVNEALAARMAPGGDVLGEKLWWPGADGEPDRGYDVVGVVRNARITRLLEDPEPTAFFSLPQHYSAPGNAFLVRVAGPPGEAADRLEGELRRVDPRIAIVNILPYGEVVRGFLYTQRMNAELFGITAALGLLLAAAGIFAVVALAVTRRRREIGIRMAVGADRGSIARLVIVTLARPLGLGVLLGGGLALLAVRGIADLLWGVAPGDPLALTAAAGVLLIAVALAVALPLFRALSVDPVRTLRAE